MEAEEQLRERLKAIVDKEGSTLVEPSCLSGECAALPPLPSAAAAPAALFDAPTPPVYRGVSACDYPLVARTPPAPASAPKGWVLLLAGAVVGLILAAVCYLVCKRPSAPTGTRRSGRRQAKGVVDRDGDSETSDVSDDEEEDDGEIPTIVKSDPPADARRPVAKRAARGVAKRRDDDDPMFQPL